MSQTRLLACLLLFIGLACLAPRSSAQPTDKGFHATNASATVKGDVPTEVNADELEYQADKKLMIGRGHVVIRQGLDVLKADQVTVRTDTQDAHAKGHVTFERGENVWRGDEMTYNFKTRQGNFGQFDAFIAPAYIHADDSKRVSETEFELKNATVTTCKEKRPQVHIAAQQARVLNGKTLKLKNATFYVGVVPVFWVPYWSKTLGEASKADFDFVPGYSSRMGAYLLTAFNCHLAPWLRSSTRLDYRTKRGFGVGQDLKWGTKASVTNKSYRGSLLTYYANDKSPMEKRPDSEVEAYSNLVDSARYRLRLSDVRNFSKRDTLYTEGSYLSDPLVVEDFFDEEYRMNVQPENRMSLVHRGDKYTAGLLLNQRLNDFYGNVNRTPEASLKVQRMQLGESPFYYESQNTASRLEKVFPDDSGTDSYDAFRVNSAHMLYYPEKYFGFLNIIPRAGYNLTYYSKTLQDHTVTNVTSTVGSNGVTSVTNSVVTTTEDMGSDVRNRYELGFETSFKAFNVLHNDWIGRDDQGLRHVVEPYTLYTYVPEPNLLPEQLPQFDSIDQYDKRNDLELGVRNKFQTKRRKKVHDLMDFNVWTMYYLEPAEGQHDFGNINFKNELRLVDWMKVDFDGAYDEYESNFQTFNTQVAFLTPDESRLAMEYRYEKDSRDQLASELTLCPNRLWSMSLYERYAFDTSTLEEHSYFIQRRMSCLGLGIGYRWTDGDVQIWMRLFLIALPGSTVQLGQ